LVQVAGASVNPLDVKPQKGFMYAFFPLAFPYTVGTDLAGTIEAVRDGATGWAVGDCIVARTNQTTGGGATGPPAFVTGDCGTSSRRTALSMRVTRACRIPAVAY